MKTHRRHWTSFTPPVLLAVPLVAVLWTVSLSATIREGAAEANSAQEKSEAVAPAPTSTPATSALSDKTQEILGRHFEPAVEPPTNGRMVGEFEHQDALFLGVNELLKHHRQTLCNIVAALEDRIEIVGLISDASQERATIDLLVDRGVSTKRMHFFLWPAESMWVQDFGPIFLVGKETRIVDTTYQFIEREVENQVPLAFAAKYGVKFKHANLSMEGGNCLSNGKGLCISTTTLVDQNKVRGYDLQAVGAILSRDFRFEQWSYLPPLKGEPTGHIDMYLTLTSPTSVVVGNFDPAVDPENAKLLDQAVATLSQVTVDDKPLEITRIPMPSHRDGKWRTYTNVIYANGVLLVPQYPSYCPESDRQALEIYRKLLPEWKVVGIDATELIEKRGSLHCLSLNLPDMPSLRSEQ